MHRSLFRAWLVGLLLVLTGAATLAAQGNSPITLTVDASQGPMKWVKTHEVIPAQPGPLTLYYPKWIPGEHQPDGPIANVTGLVFHANGQVVPWRRDLLDVFTFHVTVPQGASELDVDFDYIEPGGVGGHYTAGVSATDKLVDISWNQNLLYPAGTPAQQLMYTASLRLPSGWQFGTALPVANQSGNEITFTPVALNRLVDSPVIAGEYYRAIDLTPPGEPIHHEIDIVADSAAALNMSPEVQQEMTNVVAQSGLMFGARHYRDYHFLLTLSDHVAHFGLEHHESDDSRLPERVLLSPEAGRSLGGILPHEFVHSWNGKFRRPKDLSPPYYEEPMQTDLLWVYEGLTDYLGHVLATRAGLWTPRDFQQYLASTAASLGPGRPGRTWRDLQDTADAVPGMFGFGGWMSWRRGTDYYQEGDLIWLEVATIIHDQSNGQKSMEDFLHAFYGGPNNGPELKTYTFDQLVAALNQVVSYDWAGFLTQRLTSKSPDAPVGGIESAGWQVTYTDHAPAGGGNFRGASNTDYSIGLTVAPDGTVIDSIVGGPAFKAGITSGMKVVGVDGHIYTPAVLGDAVKATANSPQPIQLLVVNDDYYEMDTIDYQGGERYPQLVRESNRPDYLDEIAHPLGQ